MKAFDARDGAGAVWKTLSVLLSMFPVDMAH